MKSVKPSLSGITLGVLAAVNTVNADPNDLEQLRQEVRAMRSAYEARISELERKLEQYASAAEVTANSSFGTVNNAPSSNAFNPQLSIILDGQATAYTQDPEDYELPGFMLGGEAGLASEGASLGHTEITASANVDDKFFGQMTLVLHSHDGETETELEEAFVETLGLGAGLTARVGRFFPAVGYLNKQHNHAWDFADAPLVYRGLWGDTYIDDGLHLSWIAPTDLFMEFGADILAGEGFPAGGDSSSASGAQVYYVNFGGDVGISHSWQAGVSHFTASVKERKSGSHDHGDEQSLEVPSFSGDSDVTGVNLVYKWAPNGNYKNRNFKLQGEYFRRDEDGVVQLAGSEPLEFSSLIGRQNGYYLQAVYQFKPQWRTGVRYDHLASNNRGSDFEALSEAGLLDENVNPERWSLMLEWVPSEFSRLRLQYNRDESFQVVDEQFLLQYTMSLGAHGTHSF